MPEGDSLHRIARALEAALLGKRIDAFESPLPVIASALEDDGLVGHRIAAIEAHGKNLLIRFDDGRVLHTHLRMNGSWHLYRTGERWQRRASSARVTIEAEGVVAVCFFAPVVRLIGKSALRRDEPLRRLGPDILAAPFDVAEARRRLRARGDLAVGEAIVVQSSVAGIGNIYKSEALFTARLDPFAAVSALDDLALDRLLEEARRLMSANLGTAVRTTTPRTSRAGERYFVYRRRGEPCLRCRTAIRMRRQGPAARSTYYCPKCQGVDTGRPAKRSEDPV